MVTLTNITEKRRKYLGVNMWNKIKWVSIGLIISCLFYFNYQTDNQLKDRIIQLELTSSHYRTDIISLKSDIETLTSTVVFWKTEIFRQNDIFKEEAMKDINHEIGLMESKLGRLEDVIEIYSSQSNRFNESMKDDYKLFITALDTTLQITDEETMKGTQSLQEQIDQLRLEFDELIQKLEEHRRTKDIFQ